MTKKIALFAIAVLGFTTANAANGGPPGCAPIQGQLTVGVYEINLNHKLPICVVMKEDADPSTDTLTGSFTISVKPPNFPVGLVTVEEKGNGDGECSEGGAITIRGSNEVESHKVKVTVTGEAQLNEICEFWIHVADIGKLDPKVRVVGSSEMQMLQIKGLEKAIDELNLTLGQANDLLQQLRKEE